MTTESELKEKKEKILKKPKAHEKEQKSHKESENFEKEKYKNVNEMQVK